MLSLATQPLTLPSPPYVSWFLLDLLLNEVLPLAEHLLCPHYQAQFVISHNSNWHEIVLFYQFSI